MRLRLGLAAACAVACAAVPAGATPIAPARVQVVADEFTLTPSRLRLKAGPAIVELSNFGEDPHDLRFRRVGGTRVYAIKTTAPGEDTDLSVKLLPGRYTLWCSIADHRKRGMQATLRVLKVTQ
jgi:plastocyanin